MNSSAIQMRRIREATLGTLPAGTMTVMPFSTWDVKSGMTRSTPDNVNADRQQGDGPAEDLQIQGSAASDYLIGVYEGIREEAFCSTYSAAQSISGTTTAAVVSGNKLTRATGWGTIAVGDIVWVTGFVTNPAAFVAIVTSVNATDLGLDSNFITLVAESAGPTVTVAHAGQLLLGTSMLGASWEQWNTRSSKGRQYSGLGCSGWGMEFTFPKPINQTFNFVGMLKATRLSAQLANATASSPLRRNVNSNTNFGDKTVVNCGMGFRYNGTLLTDLRIEMLKLSVDNPLGASGGAGVLGPQDLDLDNDFTVKLELKCKRKGTNIDTLMDDAVDPNADKSIGFGLRDPDGNRDYFYLESCLPFNGDPDGLKKSGKETVDLTYLCRKKTTTHGVIRHARLV